MARDVTYSLEGANMLIATLKQARADVADMKAANARAGDIIVGAARPRTPNRTGALAATVRAGKAKAGVVIRAGKKSVPYAAVIHWGWPGHNIEAQPWVSVTAQATEPLWLGAYTLELASILDNVKGR